MLLFASLVSAALAGPPAEGPRTVTEALDEVCAAAPEGACAPLYAFLQVIRDVVWPAEKTWCCKSCATGERPKATCTGCIAKSEVWKCGAAHLADRPVRLTCADSIETGETVSCL